MFELARETGETDESRFYRPYHTLDFLGGETGGVGGLLGSASGLRWGKGYINIVFIKFRF